MVEAHDLSRPVEQNGDSERSAKTLPDRVAKLYLALTDQGLSPLRGITSAWLLSADGSVRAALGYDAGTGLWCFGIPELDLPSRPTLADAQAALHNLRSPFRTFPFAHADVVPNADGLPLVDLAQPPAQDEAAFLCGLLTAVCRSSLPLAPGLLTRAPLFSGAGTGKGLLVSSI